MPRVQSLPDSVVIRVPQDYDGPKPFIANYLEETSFSEGSPLTVNASVTQVRTTNANDVLDYDEDD